MIVIFNFMHYSDFNMKRHENIMRNHSTSALIAADTSKTEEILLKHSSPYHLYNGTQSLFMSNLRYLPNPKLWYLPLLSR